MRKGETDQCNSYIAFDAYHCGCVQHERLGKSNQNLQGRVIVISLSHRVIGDKISYVSLRTCPNTTMANLVAGDVANVAKYLIQAPRACTTAPVINLYLEAKCGWNL